jgi:hypothetical protein
MHTTTFEYLTPTERQNEMMAKMRRAFAMCGNEIERLVPDGPDRMVAFGKLREAAMWCNVAITREPDGAPRTE